MASIELRTPKNKPAYYKITASITLNGQTIRKFSRFEFDPKTLKTAKQRVAAATAAAFEFEAKAQEEAERSLSGANKPFQELAEEYIASAKAKLEPAALLRGNYDSDKKQGKYNAQQSWLSEENRKRSAMVCQKVRVRNHKRGLRKSY